VYYYFVDHLGNTRSMTGAAGSVCFKADYLPYGAENTPSGFTNSCNTTYKFTGYERDSETGGWDSFERAQRARVGGPCFASLAKRGACSVVKGATGFASRR